MKSDLPEWLDGGSSRKSGGGHGGRHHRRPLPGWFWPGVCGAALVGLAAAGYALWPRPHAPASKPAPTQETGTQPPATPYSAQNPAPAWPGPLPYPVVISDQGNRSLIEVTPAGKVVWSLTAPKVGSVAIAPKSVAFTPDGNQLLVTAQSQDVLAEFNYHSHALIWSFGAPGHPGSDDRHLNYPDAGSMLANGDVAVADIRNCRELLIGPNAQVVATWGKPQSGYCQTDLAKGLFGYPDGSTPAPNGDVLVTFGSGDHVALLTAAGQVVWDSPVPFLYAGFSADAALDAAGDVVVCGYANPGSVIAYDPKTGRELWHYFVTQGPGALDDPDAVAPLPNGNVVVADSGHHRVVVIDPTQGRIVWQYAQGLRDPEGLALDLYHDWRQAGSSATS